MRRRIHDALCDKPRAGGNFQYGFAFTTGRISPYIFSYATRSFRMKRSYRPAFLSQKSLRSCMAIAPKKLETSNYNTRIMQ